MAEPVDATTRGPALFHTLREACPFGADSRANRPRIAGNSGNHSVMLGIVYCAAAP